MVTKKSLHRNSRSLNELVRYVVYLGTATTPREGPDLRRLLSRTTKVLCVKKPRISKVQATRRSSIVRCSFIHSDGEVMIFRRATLGCRGIV